MSNLFDFVYEGLHSTPLLGAALSQHLTEEYGPDVFAGGYVAFSNDRRVLGVRVYMTITEGRGDTPHGDGMEAWLDFEAWMADLDSHHVITFAYRPDQTTHDMEPTRGDTHIFDATDRNCRLADIVYHGHIITNGMSHGFLLNRSQEDGNDIANLMDGLSTETKVRIGRDLLTGLVENSPDIDPVVVDAVENVLAYLESGDDPANAPKELRDEVESALRILRARLAALDGQPPRPANLLDLPPINKRPDVPPAFYH